MIQPEMSPKPSGPGPQLGARRMAADDIDLPPLPPSVTTEKSVLGGGVPDTPARQRTGRKLAPLLMTAGLIATLSIANWFWQRHHPAEASHPNWNHVAAAANASTSQRTTVVIQRNVAGTTRKSPSVQLTLADADPVTTQAVRDLLLKNNLAGANTALQAAQSLPATALVKQRQASPVLAPNSKLLTAVRDGNAEFYYLRLSDCCAVDGDIVDIAVNGEPFATVRLTHDQSVLSVPLIRGTTVFTLRGVHDGGGGITVLFQTSQGEFFCQPMDVGEEYQVGVVVQ